MGALLGAVLLARAAANLVRTVAVVVALVLAVIGIMILRGEDYPPDMVYICRKQLTLDLRRAQMEGDYVPEVRPRACTGIDDGTLRRYVAEIRKSEGL